MQEQCYCQAESGLSAGAVLQGGLQVRMLQLSALHSRQDPGGMSDMDRRRRAADCSLILGSCDTPLTACITCLHSRQAQCLGPATATLTYESWHRDIMAMDHPQIGQH